MPAVKNTMEVINGANQSINSYYDMSLDNLNDIYYNSNNAFDMIVNAFKFGYVQGAKATKAYIKKQNKTAKGSINNGNNGRYGLAR